jgi:hypothetical protein
VLRGRDYAENIDPVKTAFTPNRFQEQEREQVSFKEAA